MASKSKGKKGKNETKKRVKKTKETKKKNPKLKYAKSSKSFKAGLVISTSRVEKLIREKRFTKRVSKHASLFVAAAVDTVMRIIIKEASQEAIDSGLSKVALCHIISAVRSEKEISNVFSSFTFSSSSEVPKAIDHILCDYDVKKRAALKQARLAEKQSKKDAEMQENADAQEEEEADPLSNAV